MQNEKDILTPEEVEQFLRKLEIEYPELTNPRKPENSDKSGLASDVPTEPISSSESRRDVEL